MHFAPNAYPLLKRLKVTYCVHPPAASEIPIGIYLFKSILVRIAAKLLEMTFPATGMLIYDTRLPNLPFTEVGRLEEWYKKCRIVYYNINKKKQ